MPNNLSEINHTFFLFVLMTTNSEVSKSGEWLGKGGDWNVKGGTVSGTRGGGCARGGGVRDLNFFFLSIFVP